MVYAKNEKEQGLIPIIYGLVFQGCFKRNYGSASSMLRGGKNGLILQLKSKS